MTKDLFILFVDDDEDDYNLFADAIGNFQNDVKVIFFKTGDSALSYLKESLLANTLPRLIILDINMPPMNGKETLHEMKKLLPVTVPFLFFSTSLRDQDIIHEEKEGLMIMKKPATIDGYSNFAFTILDLFFSDIRLKKNGGKES